MGHGLQRREIAVQFPVRGKRPCSSFSKYHDSLWDLPNYLFDGFHGFFRKGGEAAWFRSLIHSHSAEDNNTGMYSLSTCIYCLWRDKFSHIAVIITSRIMGLISPKVMDFFLATGTGIYDPFRSSSNEEMQLFPEAAAMPSNQFHLLPSFVRLFICI